MNGTIHTIDDSGRGDQRGNPEFPRDHLTLTFTSIGLPTDGTNLIVYSPD